MAYYSKYSGKEVDERLDRVDSIPTKISQLLNDKDYITEIELKAILDKIPIVDFSKIPIDEDTIYWSENSDGKLVLKSKGGGEDSNWSVKKDSNGNKYIYTELPVVTQYGVTMYGNSGDINLSSLYAGLPIDNQTIYWDNGVLKSLGGGEGLDEEALRNYLLINGYATESWVLNLGYIGPEGLKNYVDISSNQDINGKKNFKSGISINGLDIYQSQDDVIYIDANLVVRGGITMFSDRGDVDIPSIAQGLPFDNRTIWYNPETNQIEVIGGTGGGSGEGVSNFWDLSGIPSWITNTKPAYSYTEIQGTPDLSVYALKSYVDDELTKYVTLGDSQEIKGEKDFTGGLKVNGSTITYDKTNKYWKLEGDLLVTGGVTMYGNEGTYTPSTIMDALLYDDTTLGINSNGQLYVKGGTSGGGLDITALQNYLTQNSYLNVTEGDARYLKLSGGTINGKLTIKNSTREALDIISTDIYGPLVKLCYYNDVALSSFGHIRKATESNLGAYWMNNESGCGIMLGSDGKTYIFTNQVVKAEYEIWHSGNDGSGSGLDADLLDGIDSSLMFYARKGSITSNNVNTTLANGVYYTAAYTPISGVYSYGTFINFRSNAVGVNSRQTQFYIPDGGQSEQTNFGARIYFRDSWNSTDSIATSWHEIITDSRIKDYNAGSATKLQTARTIWGQSFDGTGNVDGSLTINKATTSSGDYGACVLINGTYAETGFHRALSYENQKMALGSQAAVYIGAKNNQYNGGFLGFKYVSANSSSNYMSIGLYAANDLLCVLGNGNVGIGTTSPEAKAHILSSEFNILKVTRNNAFGAGIYFSNSNGELGDIGFHDNKNFVIRNSAHDTDLMVLSQSGNLLVIGGMTMYSQRSLKNVVNERGLSLSELSTIKPTRYTWKDGRDNRLHFGGIADDIQQVLPEVVYSTSDGILTMDYGNAAFAVASSLIQPVVDHEKRIAMLEEENKQLRQEVERLKSA